MKIAILADIHGNSIALEKVLNEARGKKIKKLFILGDLVGYYYRAKKVLELLSEWDREVIRGNHERMLKIIIEQPEFSEKYRRKCGSALDIVIKELNKDEIKYLQELPKNKIVEIDKIKFDLHHGAPQDEDVRLYPDSPEVEFEKALAQSADFVLVGHSHYQFKYCQFGKCLINPGSVGQSRLEGGIANWCIIDTGDKSVKLMKTKFNTKELAEEVKLIDPEIPYLGQVLMGEK
ncbi:MAG: YfcE family phosphodiesterase [Candidatus Subteraquimicrobiales bacterium]|nr:YfcE family phosphodiesterase [Candidatus Subteraquimicrobiales bacterium]